MLTRPEPMYRPFSFLGLPPPSRSTSHTLAVYFKRSLGRPSSTRLARPASASCSDIGNGRLVCLIGVAPLRPAEFVILRIGQKTVDSQ